MSEPAPRDIVLVVDDAPETLSLLADILDRNGMTALAARSAHSAFSLLDRISPDIILMDAMMPEMDGFEACRQIKRRAAFSLVPVIFMTGLAETEHVIKGFEAGGVDYVTKPVVPDEIVARIKTHLANSRLAQSARVALDVSGQVLSAVNDRGEVIWSTPQAGALMRSMLPKEAEGTNAWWAGLQPLLREIALQRRSDVVLLETTSATIKASFLGIAGPDQFLLSLSNARTRSDAEILSAKFELTDRETEVLLWIAQGKSNRDIAEILNCSHRTVNKHLEQIYSKLDVENRTAAATLAVRLLIER